MRLNAYQLGNAFVVTEWINVLCVLNLNRSHWIVGMLYVLTMGMSLEYRQIQQHRKKGSHMFDKLRLRKIYDGIRQREKIYTPKHLKK